MSLKDHEVAAVVRGHVKVLTNRDAGQVLLDYIDPQMVLTLMYSTDPAFRSVCGSPEDLLRYRGLYNH